MAALSFKKTLAITFPSPIVILCSRLDLPGGVERAIVNTANLLQSRGHTVVLLVLDETNQVFYPLHPGVEVVQAALDFGITTKGNKLTRKLRFYSHIQKLKTLFQRLKPEVIVGTEYPQTIAGYLANEGAAGIFAWEHHHFHWLRKNVFWQLLWRRIYPRLHAVICLNKTEEELFSRAGCRTTVIPNFVERQERSTLSQKMILSIGWLIHRKGFDRIPAIAQKVFQRHPDWQWKIIGRGEEQAALEKAIEEKGLAKNVSIVPPASSQLQEVYRPASLFVMTSRFECFPMVLLEAMAYGLPCVSFDCPTGPSFIIKDNVDGNLIWQGDTDAMAEAILHLLQDEQKRKAFGDAAYKNVERFSPREIYALWESLLRSKPVNS